MIPHLDLIAPAVLAAAATYAVLHVTWRRRMVALERDLQTCTEAICQMADNQMATRRKLSGAVAELEDKVVQMAAPARKPGVDLDRRHRVLRLAGNGVAVEDISRRLKVPRGEAELILNLRKYVEAGTALRPASNGDVKNHA